MCRDVCRTTTSGNPFHVVDRGCNQKDGRGEKVKAGRVLIFSGFLLLIVFLLVTLLLLHNVMALQAPVCFQAISKLELVSRLLRLKTFFLCLGIYAEQQKSTYDRAQVLYLFGALGEIRTPDLRIRSPLLYPAELQAQRVGIVTYDRNIFNYFMLTQR